MSYTLAFYEKNVYTGSTKIKNFDEAVSHLLACMERYTQANGFYTDDSGTNSFMVIDLSPSTKTIKLTGPLTSEDKTTIKAHINASFD